MGRTDGRALPQPRLASFPHGRIDGARGQLGLRPWEGGSLKASLGHERLRYDLQGGAEIHNRATVSLGLEQTINDKMRFKASADAGAAQTRYGLGLDWRLGGSTLGVQVLDIRGRDQAPHDNRIQLSWTFPLGKAAGQSGPLAAGKIEDRPAPSSSVPPAFRLTLTGLLDQIAQRPKWMPSQVIAKRDTTAVPTRQIVIDKTALAAGSTIDTATGNVTVPLGVTVTGINGITKNAAVFTNAGQFAASGTNLLVYANLIAQPAAGVTDSYIVTLDNQGGGTTNVTINVERGSVKIVSVAVADASDTTPTAFSFTDVTGQTLSTLVESNSITVAGINAAVSISVNTGEYQIGGGAWTSSAGTVTVGQTVKVRHTTSASNSTATNTTLTIGGVSDTFTTTTIASGYVQQGGLTWTPNNATVPSPGYAGWSTANTFCTTQTINGQTGWRLPTRDELVSLYNSGAINGQGWALNNTWSSTPNGDGNHYNVNWNNGNVNWNNDANNNYVTCVR